MSGEALEYRPVERVCPWCNRKHWEHGILCKGCEGIFQLEEHSKLLYGGAR